MGSSGLEDKAGGQAPTRTAQTPPPPAPEAIIDLTGEEGVPQVEGDRLPNPQPVLEGAGRPGLNDRIKAFFANPDWKPSSIAAAVFAGLVGIGIVAFATRAPAWIRDIASPEQDTEERNVVEPEPDALGRDLVDPDVFVPEADIVDPERSLPDQEFSIAVAETEFFGTLIDIYEREAGISMFVTPDGELVDFMAAHPNYPADFFQDRIDNGEVIALFAGNFVGSAGGELFGAYLANGSTVHVARYDGVDQLPGDSFVPFVGLPLDGASDLGDWTQPRLNQAVRSFAWDEDGNGFDEFGFVNPWTCEVVVTFNTAPSVPQVSGVKAEIVGTLDVPGGCTNLAIEAGDFDGDGVDTLVAFDRGTGMWHVWSDSPDGIADMTFEHADGTDFSLIFPMVGDWDSDGVDQIGWFDSTLRSLVLGSDAVADMSPLNPFARVEMVDLGTLVPYETPGTDLGPPSVSGEPSSLVPGDFLRQDERNFWLILPDPNSDALVRVWINPDVCVESFTEEFGEPQPVTWDDLEGLNGYDPEGNSVDCHLDQLRQALT